MSDILLSKESKEILIDIYKSYKQNIKLNIETPNDFESSYIDDLCKKYSDDIVYNSLTLFKEHEFIKLYVDAGFKFNQLGISFAENLLPGNRFKSWLVNNLLAILALIVSIVGLFLPK